MIIPSQRSTSFERTQSALFNRKYSLPHAEMQTRAERNTASGERSKALLICRWRANRPKSGVEIATEDVRLFQFPHSLSYVLHLSIANETVIA